MDDDFKKQLRGVYDMLGKMFASDQPEGSTLKDMGPKTDVEAPVEEVMDTGADQKEVQQDGKSVKKALYSKLIAKKQAK